MNAEQKRKYIKYKEGPARYGICESTIIKRAKEAGAVIKLGKSALVDTEIFERYLDTFRLPPQ